MKKLMSIVLAALLLASCNDGPTLSRHEVKPLTLTAEEKAMCAAENDYSVRLLKEVCEQEQANVFVSPLSAAFVSAMLANGAVGETQAEILKAIGLEGYELSELNAHYLNLMEKLPYQDATTFLALANGVWVDEGYPIKTDFSDACTTHYLAEVKNLELSDPSNASVLDQWASKHTKGMVQHIANPNLFGEDLHLVLCNALCFKAKWDKEFKKSNTRNRTFFTPSGEVSVPMMEGEVWATFCAPEYFDHYEVHDWVKREAGVLRLYYKDKGYCMDVVMPTEQRLEEWMESFTMQWLDSMLSRVSSSADIEVVMPKFTMEKRYRLNSYMQELGMQKAFSPADARFTGISDQPLYLDLLQQDTYIEVDEEGTKAAAVTSGWMMDGGSDVFDRFVVDHPFIFFIRDVKNGIVLFAGRVSNPQE